ncbi:MAG: hypothetical protein EOO88_08530 [Pedobacter sp.]|nr:MAG: hypothetical protein EOO88_08530 [Pedobacter sp.]
MNKKNESELLQLIKDGDTHAFRQVYDAYGKKLFYFSRSMNLDAENSEEIVQETFMSQNFSIRKFKH